MTSFIGIPLSRRWRTAVAVAAGVCTSVVLGFAGPVSAAPTGVIARYGAGHLNLAAGWGTAQSCVVTDTATTCYASHAEADAATGAPRTTNSSIPACASNYLCLYDLQNGGGRRLIFRDEGWQSLVAYGFERQTSSWRNNQPCSDVALLGDGQGHILTLGNCSYGASMGSWDNVAVDVGP